MRRFIFFMGFLSLILDFYAFQGLKKLTASWKSESIRKLVHWGYWLFFILFTGCFMFAINQRFSAGIDNAFVKWVMSLFIAFFVTKLIFVVFLFAEDLGRVFVGLYRLIFSRKETETAGEKSYLPDRRKFISQAAFILAGLNLGAFLYGIAKGKYNYKVHRLTLFFEDLPAAFDGFTITQLSDFHAGSFDDMAEVKRGLALVQAQNSDLLVFTGDMVNNLATEVEPFIQELAKLKAPFGKFSVLGNHDYGLYAKWPSKAAEEANVEALKKHQAAMGFKLLIDENVTLKKGGEEIQLLGVENWGTGFIQKGDLTQALSRVNKNAFKILLSHDPSHWEEIVKKHPTPIHLTLSGHTHGMQVGIETPIGSWSPARFRYKTWAGLASENGRKLYVNRGFGFIGFSGRVGIWPEITVLELRKGKA